MTAYAQTVDPTRVVGRRIGAWAIDLLIYLILAWVLSLAIHNNGSRQVDLTNSQQTGTQYCDQWRQSHDGYCFNFSSGTQKTAYTVTPSPYPFVVVFGHMALYALVQGLLGASLGKLAVGLRVVDSNGELCGIRRSFIRTFLWIVDAITLTIPLVGGVLMVSTKGHRRVGDMGAGTFVVDKAAVGYPVAEPGLSAAAQGPSPFPGYGQPPGYGPPPWSGPTPGQAEPPTDTAAPSGNEHAPRWDPARDTYIQWDDNRQAWLEWDDSVKEWKPIST